MLERPVAVAIAVGASVRLSQYAVGSSGRKGDLTLTPGRVKCARWRQLSGTAVGRRPEPVIVGEAETVGGMASGEADVATSFAVLAPAPGSWKVYAT